MTENEGRVIRAQQHLHEISRQLSAVRAQLVTYEDERKLLEDEITQTHDWRTNPNNGRPMVYKLNIIINHEQRIELFAQFDELKREYLPMLKARAELKAREKAAERDLNHAQQDLRRQQRGGAKKPRTKPEARPAKEAKPKQLKLF